MSLLPCCGPANHAAELFDGVGAGGWLAFPSVVLLAVPCSRHLCGEEEKMQQETQKILGALRGDHIEPLAAKVSAHCNRVPVVDGHTVTVSVELANKASEAELIQAFNSYTSLPQQRNLPSAPKRPVQYMPEADRPQPRKDVERDNGMAAYMAASARARSSTINS